MYYDAKMLSFFFTLLTVQRSCDFSKLICRNSKNSYLNSYLIYISVILHYNYIFHAISLR